MLLKNFHPNIKVRIATSFVSKLSSSMIFPFIALYLANFYDIHTVGLIIIATIGVQFIANLYGGHLADLWGRKRVLLLSEYMRLLSFILLLLVNSPLIILPWCSIVALLLVNVSSGLMNPAASAMLIDDSTPEQRPAMYTINYWSSNLALLVGIAIGGWFFKDHFFVLLMCLVIMSILSLLMTIVLISDNYRILSDTAKSYGIKGVISNYIQVSKDRPFMLFFVASILITGLEFQRDKYILLRLNNDFMGQSFNFLMIELKALDGAKLLSLLSIENTILVLGLVAISIKVTSGNNRAILMYVGFALFGLGHGLLLLGVGLPMLFLGMFILTLGELLYIPIHETFFAEFAANGQRGIYMAMNSLIFQGAKIMGAFGLFIGVEVGRIGVALIFFIMTVMCIFLTFIAISKRNRVVQITTE